MNREEQQNGLHEHHVHGESCGCGHEHHAHDESCGCGHEHHVHDESCGCGHEHHVHDESCGCEHEHHAHHEYHVHETVPDDGSEKRVYILENLGCANCAAKMEARIRALPGVSYAAITFATKQLRVSAEDYESILPEIRKICASIESQVTVRERSEDLRKQADESGRKERRSERFQIITGAALFVLGAVLLHLGTGDMQLLPLFIAAYLVLGGRILLEAGRNILHGKVFDENFLMCIATLGAFAIREFPEAVGVMLFYRVGEYFEHRAVERSRSQIMDAVDMRPELVNLIADGEVRAVPAASAQPGDLLLIRPGDRIPLDGVVTEGESRIDTSPITGEPVPVTVRPGDRVTSGCINSDGQLKMRAEKPLSESMVSRILDSVENAAASKPRIDRFITRFARVYTPVVVAAAAATAVIPSLLTGNWNHWVYTALTFLVMSCPCALVLSVPLAFFSGIGAGSRRGILFKGGAAIEALSGLRAVVMDKTGTITRGDFRLQKIASAGRIDGEALLRLCAGCEQDSTHPIACSIVAAARERGLEFPRADSMQELAGHGVAARFGKDDVLCGNRRLMEKYGVAVENAPAEHGAQVFVAVNGRLEGEILVSDTIRPDAAAAVARLKDMGMHTAMLTGDSEEAARAVARETGIEQVCARLLPQDKLSRMAEIRREHGAVMFVGDGINDAPVLAGADVGAAMGGGADAAIEAADAVFMTASVDAVPEAICIARRTKRIAMGNVVFALAVKLAVMALGLCGYASMWMAVFADTGVAMICVLNSIRMLYTRKR